jgi:hypothetical protein
MKLPSGLCASLFAWIFLTLAVAIHCGKKPEANTQPGSELPPLASPGDAPEYVRSLSLLYPQAELYRATAAEKSSGKPGIILQKTNHPLEDVVRYYTETLQKHDFTETTHLVQSNGALLQYERKPENNSDRRELLSIDISKLPYADNLLIRIGRSEADYGRGGAP